MVPIVFFLAASAFGAIAAVLSFVAGHLISNDQTRKRGWYLVGVVVVFWLMQSSTSFVESQFSDAERKHAEEIRSLELAKLRSVTDQVSSGMDTSLDRLENTTSSLSRVESSMNSNLELSVKATELIDATAQRLHIAQRRYAADTLIRTRYNLLDEWEKSRWAQDSRYLESQRATLRAIQDHLRSGTVPNSSQIAVLRGNILQVAENLKTRYDQNLKGVQADVFHDATDPAGKDGWDHVQQRYVDCVYQLNQHLSVLKDKLSSIIQELSSEPLQCYDLVFVTHRLELWTITYEAACRSSSHDLKRIGLECQITGLAKYVEAIDPSFPEELLKIPVINDELRVTKSIREIGNAK